MQMYELKKKIKNMIPHPPADKYYRKLGVKIGKRFSRREPISFGSEPYLITLGDDVRIS